MRRLHNLLAVYLYSLVILNQISLLFIMAASHAIVTISTQEDIPKPLDPVRGADTATPDSLTFKDFSVPDLQTHQHLGEEINNVPVAIMNSNRRKKNSCTPNSFLQLVESPPGMI